MTTMDGIRARDEIARGGVIDMATTELRAVNALLQSQTAAGDWSIRNARGAHALAVGLDAPLTLTIEGSTGY